MTWQCAPRTAWGDEKKKKKLQIFRGVNKDTWDEQTATQGGKQVHKSD